MEKNTKKALEEIENQLYDINSINIRLKWIGLNGKPTEKEISELNEMLGFIIKELRILRETGEIDIKKLHKEHFGGGVNLKMKKKKISAHIIIGQVEI